MTERSTQRIVHFELDVKSWTAAIPPVSAARPRRCPVCAAPGHELGSRVTLIGHGLRERQVRGPSGATAPATTAVVCCRRYLCLACTAVILVAPRGTTARRHFGAGALALALLLYGTGELSAVETGARVGLWGRSDPSCLRTLARWTAAVHRGRLFARLRMGPAGEPGPQRDAERIARALIALVPSSEGTPAERAFAGGALAA
jgi:hypothetical protein